MPAGLSRIADRILRRDRAAAAPSPEPAPSLGGFSWQSGPRPRAGSESPSPEGWHLSPTTPTLRIANPDLPSPEAAVRPAPDYGKPLPPLPPDSTQTHTPASISRSGSPEGGMDMRSAVYGTAPALPADVTPRVLRVMNPDPGPVPNFSRPFGPANPFPARPLQPMPPRPAPYRPGLDPESPLYGGRSLAEARQYPRQEMPPRSAPYRPGLDPESPRYRGEPVSGAPIRPYSNFRPAQISRPRPPLAPLIIPVFAPALPAPQAAQYLPQNLPHRNGVPTGRPRFPVDSPNSPGPGSPERYARPANPTPYHPYNMLSRPVEPPHTPSPRSRRNTVASAPGLDTILEGNENAVTRKPAPPVPPPKDFPPTADPPARVAGRRLATLPRGLQWLVFSSWGKRPTAKRSGTRGLLD